MTSSSGRPSFRELLEQEPYPLDYIHKVIGRNTPSFDSGLEALKRTFPALRQTGERLSSGGANRAVTYSFLAHTADEIIALVEATAKVPDLVMQL